VNDVHQFARQLLDVLPEGVNVRAYQYQGFNFIVAEEKKDMDLVGAAAFLLALHEPQATGSPAVDLLPTGKTPEELYGIVAGWVKEGTVTLKDLTVTLNGLTGFHLDEYHGTAAIDYFDYVYRRKGLIAQLKRTGVPREHWPTIHVIRDLPIHDADSPQARQMVRDAYKTYFAAHGVTVVRNQSEKALRIQAIRRANPDAEDVELSFVTKAELNQLISEYLTVTIPSAQYRGAIEQAGGVHTTMHGLGSAGHIAFLEHVSWLAYLFLAWVYRRNPDVLYAPVLGPLVSWAIADFRIGLVELEESTLAANSHDHIRERGIHAANTVSLKEILAARHVILLANGAHKVFGMANMLTGLWREAPAAVLKFVPMSGHGDVTVIVDGALFEDLREDLKRELTPIPSFETDVTPVPVDADVSGALRAARAAEPSG
jgi:6-phosphogluconolactonase/glucosamine-6-phosphate isomerase/deaminase